MMFPIASVLSATLALVAAVWTPGEIRASETAQGSTLVCAGLGGDGLSLVEWTAGELAEYETRSGHPPALAHPQTGTCRDPAGLMVNSGWVPGTRWLCSRDASGRWSANWAWEIYQTGREVPPDPVTGRCPQTPAAGILNETAYAAATAVHLTELEVAGDYDRLYAWMHPDSQAVTPQSAMTGWYLSEFSQRPPAWMSVDDVRLDAWTWDVTGKRYPSTAHVAYRQRLADGTPVSGTIHLVRDGGVWRWFFGVTAAATGQ